MRPVCRTDSPFDERVVHAKAASAQGFERGVVASFAERREHAGGSLRATEADTSRIDQAERGTP